MPQASDALRAKFADDASAISLLEGAGFVLLPSWSWLLPSPTYVPTQEQYDAIDYLIGEWDYGGISWPNQHKRFA